MVKAPWRRQSSKMSLKTRHTRHRAKAPVSPRASRPSVKQVSRSKAKPKAAKK
ncbi:MAG: hypothetical protein RL303_859 [Verrucomicrobiota bacterium]|jgi:hypothetical protein